MSEAVAVEGTAEVEGSTGPAVASVASDGSRPAEPALRALAARLPDDLPAVERRAALPGGFVAAGGTAGIKRSGRPDLAVIAVADGATGRGGDHHQSRPAAVAALFTRNLVPAAPVRTSRAHLLATAPAGGGRNGWTQALIATSGSANAATGPDGDADQRALAVALADALGTSAELTLAMSTGVIGTRLPVERLVALLPSYVTGLEATDDALLAAATALKTTDSTTKVATTTVRLPGAGGSPVEVRVSGIAKGVGMIHPRLATMLSVILTDAVADPALLESVLRPAAARTWNQLSVDGDTSTNDTVFLLASGASRAALVLPGTPAAATLGAAVEAVARDLARQQAADGEGAATLIDCQVTGARSDADARAVARSVVSSSLVKAAIHGRDPNWGRIAAAAGNAVLPDVELLVAGGMPRVEAESRAGRAVSLAQDRLRIAIAGHLVFDGPAGGPVEFDRDAARAALDAPDALIRLDLGLGAGIGEAWGCDLTEEYVRENSEYTT
ncbi:MAG TPA: bifunctional ornithine acetyltransferase/N-acetylglutamate synthase [Candidatus Limnocylindrales bacterium]|nr:bifunctional ornithine acetyltransferase/N-acetylglutamate synthase [Candidatus Limnocylindrales bacterium]